MSGTSEIWLVVDGWGGRYEISNLGNVRSLGQLMMRQSVHYKNGYRSILFKLKGAQKRVTVHSLVARYFIENPLGLKEVNHKDGDKANNRADNLEWCTRSCNCLHAIRTGLRPVNGSQKSILAIKDVAVQEFQSISQACATLKISRRTISRILDTAKPFLGYNFYSA